MVVSFTLRYLTRPEYAIFAIAGDLLSWLGLAGLGVSSVFNSRDDLSFIFLSIARSPYNVL